MSILSSLTFKMCIRDRDLFAVMKKSPGDQLAAGGWLWNEVRPDGSVVFSAGRKGDACIGCHSNDPNRDLVRVFDLY